MSASRSSHGSRPLAIAHRGASGQRPENTLAAFELAVEQRADMIEIDLHRCADGDIVIRHDEELVSLGGSGEIADGLLTLHTVPKQVNDVRALLAQGVAKRSDGKSLKDLEIISGVSVTLTDDVQGTIDAAKRGIALYAGGFGARDINFHKDAFAKRGYQAEADRIQELFLAGHRDEAAKVVPDEYVDEEMLIGPPQRIKERFAIWRDSGFTTLRINSNSEDVLKLIADSNAG